MTDLTSPILLLRPPQIEFGIGQAGAVGRWASTTGFTRTLVVADAFNADRIDVLFIGTGMEIAPLDPAIRAAFSERSVIVEAVPTRSAVSTYNILLAEQRAVAAALIAVENLR